MCSNERVPTLLVFGRLARFPGLQTSTTQGDKKPPVTVALTKTSQAGSETSIDLAVRGQLPPAGLPMIRLGDKVRVYL